MEINRRTAAENEFVVLKKVRDKGGWGGAVRTPSPGCGLWLESWGWSISASSPPLLVLSTPFGEPGSKELRLGKKDNF